MAILVLGCCIMKIREEEKLVESTSQGVWNYFVVFICMQKGL